MSFSALFNGAGAGQSDMSTLSLVTHTIYTNKHSHAVSYRHAAVRAYVTQTHRLTVTHSQTDTHERNGGGAFFLFCFVFCSGHSHKQVLFKVSGKVPPSSLYLKE